MNKNRPVLNYRVHVGRKGRSKEVKLPGTAGTTGQSKSIIGIKIWLDEAGAKDFDILYRLHKFDGECTAWVKNSTRFK